MKKLLGLCRSRKRCLKKTETRDRDAALHGEIKRLNARVDQLSKDNARLTRALTETYIQRIDQ
jgi:hypothetical protein